MENAGWVLLAVVVAVVYVALLVINWLKGKYGFALMGIFLAWFPMVVVLVVVGAIRIAKPESWWFDNRYHPKSAQVKTAEDMWTRGLAGYVVIVALVTLVIAGLIAIPLLIMGDLDL